MINFFSELKEGFFSFLKKIFIIQLSVFIPLLLIAIFCRWFIKESVYYFFIGSNFTLEGAVPYRDFLLEHPPGAFFYFMLLAFFFSTWFPGVYACLNYVITFFLLFRSQLLSSDKIHEFFCLIWLSPYILFRYDILPAILSYFSFKSLIKDRLILSGFLLGLGITVKIYPVFLLPLFIIYLLKRKGDDRSLGEVKILIRVQNLIRRLFFYLGSLFLGLAFPLLLLFLIGGQKTLASCLEQIFFYHFNRGVQIESLWGGVYLLLNYPTAKDLIIFNFGSYNVINFSEIFLKIIPMIECFVLGAVYISFPFSLRKMKIFSGSDKKQENKAARQILAGYSTLAILLLIFFNKVFSPQYLLWPLFFILEIKREKKGWFSSFSIYTLIAILSFMILALYGSLTSGSLLVLIILNLRNLLMGLLIFLVIKDLRLFKKRI